LIDFKISHLSGARNEIKVFSGLEFIGSIISHQDVSVSEILKKQSMVCRARPKRFGNDVGRKLILARIGLK
jgi:hypothetical protein